jgi:hypothetical protein
MTPNETLRAILRHSGLLLAAGGLLLLAGCGGGSDGPTRYHLSGAVTFGGKPVPAGSVTFSPDLSKGNHGPAGTAPIKAGKFDTALDGTGHVGGPHVVSVTGLDGVTSPDLPMGTPIFADYKLSVDLPKQDSAHNIDVPAPGKVTR